MSLLEEIRQQAAGNLPLQKALVAGAVMEGGSLEGPWPRGDGGCAAGPYQVRWWMNPCDRGKVWQGHPLSAEEAENPTIAVAYAIGGLGYRENARRYSDPVNVAYHSERPGSYYSEEQQARAWNAIAEVFGMAAQPPLTWFPAHANNYTAGRPASVLYEAVVLHTTDGGNSLEDLGAWFANPTARASTHYGVDRDGRIGQFVSLQNTAYAHGLVDSPTARLVFDNAGLNPNLWAVGIEHVDGGVPGTVTEAQLEASARLCAWLFQSELLPYAATTGTAVDRDHIILHREIDSVTRARCPSWPEERVARYIARVRELLVVEPGPEPVDYAALYAAELRGYLAAALDDKQRAEVRIADLEQKLAAL